MASSVSNQIDYIERLAARMTPADIEAAFAEVRRLDEYQANEHPGRCRSKVYLECWYNTLTAAASSDGGRSFSRGIAEAVS